ncbi:hypothetical protein [Cardinium endosymbiont of Tipula unca]
MLDGFLKDEMLEWTFKQLRQTGYDVDSHSNKQSNETKRMA